MMRAVQTDEALQSQPRTGFADQTAPTPASPSTLVSPDTANRFITSTAEHSRRLDSWILAERARLTAVEEQAKRFDAELATLEARNRRLVDEIQAIEEAARADMVSDVDRMRYDGLIVDQNAAVDRHRAILTRRRALVGEYHVAVERINDSIALYNAVAR
jgi:hypothetical protein